MSEKFECISLVTRMSRLSRLNLSQKSDGLIAVLVAIVAQHCVQMCLCCLEISHMEQDFCQTEECLIVARIMAQALLIALKGSVVVFLNMLYLA